jgi:hypothetical protein
MSPESYSIFLIKEIRFSDRKGPHTLNVRGDEIFFDPYLIAVPKDWEDLFGIS